MGVGRETVPCAVSNPADGSSLEGDAFRGRGEELSLPSWPGGGGLEHEGPDGTLHTVCTCELMPTGGELIYIAQKAT